MKDEKKMVREITHNVGHNDFEKRFQLLSAFRNTASVAR